MFLLLLLLLRCRLITGWKSSNHSHSDSGTCSILSSKISNLLRIKRKSTCLNEGCITRLSNSFLLCNILFAGVPSASRLNWSQSLKAMQNMTSLTSSNISNHLQFSAKLLACALISWYLNPCQRQELNQRQFEQVGKFRQNITAKIRITKHRVQYCMARGKNKRSLIENEVSSFTNLVRFQSV